MDKKFCSVYEITFYSGLIGLILYGILSIFNLYYLKLDDFGEYFNNFNTTELLACIALIFTTIGYYVFQLLTNKNNTPCHIFIIHVFGNVALYLDFSTYSIVTIISLIFILFMSLIFNEIIELNFCGMSDNTKRNIIKRAKIDNLNMEKNFSICSEEDFENNENELIELKDDVI